MKTAKIAQPMKDNSKQNNFPRLPVIIFSLNSTDFEFRIQVQHGETTVKVHAYNINEQVTEFEGVYNY